MSEDIDVKISISKELWDMLEKQAGKIQSETGEYYWVGRVVVDILNQWAKGGS